MTPTVAIDDLKVGMFVHLDLGWWAHPFALSSFMITSAEQLATVRGLGLKRVRWSPDKSRILEPAAPGLALDDWHSPAPDDRRAADAAGTAESGPHAESATGSATEPTTEPTTEAHPDHLGLAHTTAAAPAVAPALLAVPTDPEALAAEQARARQRALVAAQHASTRQCAAQLAEARSAWLQASRCLADAPGQAHSIADALTRAVIDKMLADGDVCVRTLADAGGEPGAAHALNVMVVSLLVGRICGLAPPALHDLGLGAALHDIGKLALPERARHADLAQGPEAEALYRSHVALGVGQGERMGLSPGALQVLAQHHELADGQGFPAGLARDEITLAARIVALVNRYDTLCNPRQAALGLTPHEALSTLFAQSRGQFDATVMNGFIRLMGVYPPGSVVQLTDARFATVVSVNPVRPLKPSVLVCDPTVPPEEALLLDLDGQADLGVRRSVKPALLPPDVRDYLAPAERMVYFFEPVQRTCALAEQVIAA